MPSTRRDRIGDRDEALLANTGSNLSAPAGSTGDLLQFADQLVDRPEREPGDGAVGIAHDTVAVDDEHAATREPDRPERAVEAGDRLVGVGQQRKVEAVLAGERVVTVDVLGGDRRSPGRSCR